VSDWSGKYMQGYNYSVTTRFPKPNELESVGICNPRGIFAFIEVVLNFLTTD